MMFCSVVALASRGYLSETFSFLGKVQDKFHIMQHNSIYIYEYIFNTCCSRFFNPAHFVIIPYFMRYSGRPTFYIDE